MARGSHTHITHETDPPVRSHGMRTVQGIQEHVSLALKEPPGYGGDRATDVKIYSWDSRSQEPGHRGTQVQ